MVHVVFPLTCYLLAASQHVGAQNARALSQKGKDGCKCLEYHGQDHLISDGHLIVTPNANTGISYKYPEGYGSLECKTWDQNLPPYCTGTDKADFCHKLWCYVPTSCSGVTKSPSSYFDGLYWSFETCGDASAFGQYSASDQASITLLVDVLEGYLRNTRDLVESNYRSLVEARANDSSLVPCPYVELCRCSTCSFQAQWNGDFDFDQTIMFMKKGITPIQKLYDTCLASALKDMYIRVAGKEMEGGYAGRPGWQYFAFQGSGSYTQWPAQAWCPAEDYDPRFRPFFAAGVTGPKDVVIVVDVSGSMIKNERDSLAKQAVKQILQTLSWKDFATVVLFNHVIMKTYSDMLLPITETTRSAMINWVDQDDWSNGGTNFINAMDRAFDVIRQSKKAGETSMCQRAILFLTDGEAEFGETNYKSTAELAKEFDTVLFTYALGSGADTAVAKRLACENRGVFYKVPDDGDLTSIMASYYDYFASGQEVCFPSYVKYAGAAEGTEIWTGCLPAYRRTSSHPETLGVACTDVNMLVDPSELKRQSSWEDFLCRVSDITKRCRPLYLDECRLQKIRLAVGPESVCNSGSPSQDATTTQVTQVSSDKCGCVDNDCLDDNNWRDALGYYCDTWIGDDCSFLYSGYTYADLQEVRSKCPRSCGICPWHNPCPYPNGPKCEEMANVGQQCRACNGKVSGININGQDMCCPSGATDFAPLCSADAGAHKTPGVGTSANGPVSSCKAILVLNFLIVYAIFGA